MSLFALALKDPAADPAPAAALLASCAAMNGGAARTFLRRNPGFLGRALTLEAAEALKSAADSVGLVTALFSEDDIRLPPPPLKVSKIEPKGSGFYAFAGDERFFFKYEDVRLIAAAAYDAPVPPPSQEALKASVFEGVRRLAGLPGYEPADGEPGKETYFRADIMAGTENGTVRLLLEPENLDFSALGPSLSHSSLVNFRTLLDTLSAPAFNAARNAFLTAFLASKPVAAMKTAGPEACDTGLSLLLLLTSKRTD